MPYGRSTVWGLLSKLNIWYVNVTAIIDQHKHQAWDGERVCHMQ